MNMHLLHEENMQERVQAAGSRYLVQVMLESMIVVTDVQLTCTVHACARQILPGGIWNRDSRWLQKKRTPGQLNHGQAQVQHSLLLTPSQALTSTHFPVGCKMNSDKAKCVRV